MSHEQSDEFYKLREEMLTPKYRLQDTGITLILFSLAYILMLKVGNGNLRSPKKKSVIITISIALPFITIAGFVFDLFQGMYRIEFPHWADSLGIPLMGIPIQFGILLLWSLAHLSLSKNIEALPLSLSISKKLNPWLILVCSLTFLLVLVSAYYGHYWYAFPGLIWLYYYLSIGVSRLELQST